MRTPIALALYVSLILVSLPVSSSAEGLLSAPESNPEWSVLYEKGLAASEQHNYEEAAAYFRQSWETAGTAEERGASAMDLGQLYRHLSRVNEAKQWLVRASKAWSEDSHQGLKFAMTTADLADLDRATGDYSSAEQLLRESLVSPACDPAARASIRNNLADLLREEGRSEEALPLFRESINTGGATSRQREGALIGLADIDRQNGNWDSSVARWNEVLEICRREHDEETEAIALRGLATTWLRAGTLSRAEPLFRRALQMMENNSETPPEQLAGALSGLGELYRSENKLSLAENEWSRALQLDRSALGEAHPQVAWLMEMLSDVYSARGEFSLARDYATRASEMMRGSFGETSMPVATALINRAMVEQRSNDMDSAAKDYERAIDIARAHPENRALETVMIQRYAGFLKTMHREREAKQLLAQTDVGARSFR
jgi:tetratricopeptide (TPR) repeat protein